MYVTTENLDDVDIETVPIAYSEWEWWTMLTGVPEETSTTQQRSGRMNTKRKGSRITGTPKNYGKRTVKEMLNLKEK